MVWLKLKLNEKNLGPIIKSSPDIKVLNKFSLTSGELSIARILTSSTFRPLTFTFQLTVCPTIETLLID